MLGAQPIQTKEEITQGRYAADTYEDLDLEKRVSFSAADAELFHETRQRQCKSDDEGGEEQRDTQRKACACKPA